MKKVLFATTAIVLTAGAAAAQNVTISGTARAGLNYLEDRGNSNSIDDNGDFQIDEDGNLIENTDDGTTDLQVEQRLRFNIDASIETEAGVTMGGRTRIQFDENNEASELNAAYIYAEYNGLRVEVGNANTAMDSVALMYNAELGFIGQTFGSYNGQAFNAYVTGPYGIAGQVGVYGAYSISGFNIKASYLTPDQTLDDLPDGLNEEFQMAVDYNFGAFTVAGAFALDAGFIEDRDEYFLGGEYAINPDANVGLHIHYTDFSGEGLIDAISGDNQDDMTVVTLYGNYAFGAITARGYVAYNDADDGTTSLNGRTKTEDYAFGIGADYDLGGATLAGGIERGYSEQYRANLGVKFSF